MVAESLQRDDGGRILRLQVIVFLFSLAVFLAAPVVEVSDSRYAVMLSEPEPDEELEPVPELELEKPPICSRSCWSVAKADCAPERLFDCKAWAMPFCCWPASSPPPWKW